jgi:VWFA-related protein
MYLPRPVARFALAGLFISTATALCQGPAASQPSPAPVAQSAPPAGAQNPSAGSAAAVLRANANLVLLDVVVTDRNGAAVHGLDKRQLHVFEDGREQAIASFDEHKPADGAAASGAMAPRAPLPPHTFSNAPAYPEASAVNVLLLDALNTPVANQLDARRQMLEYMGKIQPGTSLGIFTLSSRLRMVEGFTTDAAALVAALKSPRAGPQTSVILDPASDQVVDSLTADMAALGASSNAIGAMQQFQADQTAFQTDQRVQMTLDAMQQLARYLNGVPGRKNLIWFSGSFPLALDPDDSLQSPFEAMRNYSDQIRETSELLSAARVAVYPVDARGLMTLASTDVSYQPSTNLVGGGTTTTYKRRGQVVTASNPVNRQNVGKDDASFLKQTLMEQASMEQIAEQTGGQDYINTNGLKEAVASAVENGSSYYTVGYVPAAKPFDGQYRKIELRTENAGFRLAYRHGYFADPPDKPSAHTPGEVSLIRAATLHGAPPATQILFQARVLPVDDPLLAGTKLPIGPAGDITANLKTPTHRVIVDVKADAHGFAYTDTPDGAHHAKVEFTLVGYDADGKRLNYLDRGFELNLNSGQFARTMTAGIPIRLALDLPPGPAFLRIAVHDLDAGRVGSLELRVADARK